MRPGEASRGTAENVDWTASTVTIQQPELHLASFPCTRHGGGAGATRGAGSALPAAGGPSSWSRFRGTRLNSRCGRGVRGPGQRGGAAGPTRSGPAPCSDRSAYLSGHNTLAAGTRLGVVEMTACPSCQDGSGNTARSPRVLLRFRVIPRPIFRRIRGRDLGMTRLVTYSHSPCRTLIRCVSCGGWDLFPAALPLW